jgi:hypothetical protein
MEISMNGIHPNWPARAVWIMLAIAAIWAIYAFASHYSSCRTDGSGQVPCFVLALFFSWLDLLVLVIATVVKLITLALP